MKSKTLWWALGALGVLFILSSLTITIVEYNRYTSQPVIFPNGSTIAGLPVGGLNQDEAAARLSEFYHLPITLKIENSTLQVLPADLGFSIDAPALANDAASQINRISFWQYLWGKQKQAPVTLPLTASVDEDQMRAYLTREIMPRYAQPGSPVSPIPGTTNFQISADSTSLDLNAAVSTLRSALLDSTSRQAELFLTQVSASDAGLNILEAFLHHQMDWIGFDGLIEIYLESTSSGQKLHFASQNGQPVTPDIAFTGASTIKIPIMISVLRALEEPTPEQAVNLLERMIIFSENPPADALMSTYLDEIRGPLMVSEDLEALGMQNTFLAGYFYLGAPVLKLYQTPANTRTDVFLDPDVYNQTVASEVGLLLSSIHTCAEDGSGLLTQTFPGEISQAECQLMVDILSANKIGLLIEAGLPPDAAVAHKHGWVQELDGVLRSMSDVAIVFTPGEDYVLTIFVYDPIRLDFDKGNRLFARLSQTVYNFFNLDNQAYWWID
jgi:hypothetical protein